MSEVEPNHVRHLLRTVVHDSPLHKCSLEFLDSIKGIIEFELQDMYPLLDSISLNDIEYYQNAPSGDMLFYESYSVKFTKHFKEQILKHYPEEIL